MLQGLPRRGRWTGTSIRPKAGMLDEKVGEIATPDSRRFIPKGAAWRTAFSMTSVGVSTFRPLV